MAGGNTAPEKDEEKKKAGLSKLLLYSYTFCIYFSAIKLIFSTSMHHIIVVAYYSYYVQSAITYS